MKIFQCLLTLLLAAGAIACDEHDDGDCGRSTLPPTELKTKCNYRVKKDQLIKVIHPGIYETNVGPECDFNEFPAIFTEHCKICSRRQKPCNNSHAACGGCDCGHEDLPWFVKAELDGMPIKTHHTCEDMKEAFKRPNYNVVACEEGDDDEEEVGSDDISAELVEDKHYNDSVLLSGVLWGSCRTHPHQIKCKKVPFILKFECDDCINKGAPKMLTKCCERCKSFVDSLANNTNIPDTVLPLAFCSGCDSKVITFEDSIRPHFPPMQWKDHARFEQYTEKLALQRQDDHLQDNICDELTPHCSEGEYKDDECFAGSCTAKKRRLEEVNASLQTCSNSSNLEAYLESLKNQNQSKPEPSSASEPITTSKPSTTQLRGQEDSWGANTTSSEPPKNHSSDDMTEADGCALLQPSIGIMAISIVASAFVR